MEERRMLEWIILRFQTTSTTETGLENQACAQKNCKQISEISFEWSASEKQRGIQDERYKGCSTPYATCAHAHTFMTSHCCNPVSISILA